MRKHGSWLFVITLGLAAVIGGCADGGNPARPSGVSVAPTVAVAPQPGMPVTTQILTGHPSPSELVARGWSCFVPPPIPSRTVCSHPNQGFPTVANPPPADRPATFTLWIYENGQFAGTELLIRPDLYCGADVTDPTGACVRKAPLCASTGQPYFFAAVIGYYECAHAPGP